MNFKKRYTTESYSVIKSNKVLTHAATQMNFENMLSEEVKTQRPHVIKFHLYDTFRIDTEGKVTVARS